MRSWRHALVAVFAIALGALVSGCGGQSEDRGFDNAVRSYISQGSAYRRSAARRGALESVHCRIRRKVMGGELFGCKVVFSRSGVERWLVLATDGFVAYPCPKRGRVLGIPVHSVCP